MKSRKQVDYILGIRVTIFYDRNSLLFRLRTESFLTTKRPVEMCCQTSVGD